MTYGSLLDDNVLDEEVLELKVFRVRVRLGVLQQASDELDGLFRPATYNHIRTKFRYEGNRLRTLSRLELLRLASTADTTVEPPEGDDLVVGEDIAEVGVRLRQLKAYIPFHFSIPFPPPTDR